MANLRDIVDKTKQMTQGMCSEVELKKVGDTYVTKSDCDFGVSKISMETVTSGDFSSEYTVKINSKTSHITLGDKSSSSVNKSKYIGACPKGMRDGDMILPDGSKFNSSDMMKEEFEKSKQMDPKQMEEMRKQLEKLREMRKKMGK